MYFSETNMHEDNTINYNHYREAMDSKKMLSDRGISLNDLNLVDTIEYKLTENDTYNTHESNDSMDTFHVDDFGIFWDFEMEHHINSEDKLILKNIIKNDNTLILMESLIKIYSQTNQTYMDLLGILVHGKLWFISANNYIIWLQLLKQTQMNKLTKANPNKKFDNKIVTQIIHNLNINNDNIHNNNNTILSKIKKYFKNKT
eukprot:375932_1